MDFCLYNEVTAQSDWKTHSHLENKLAPTACHHWDKFQTHQRIKCKKLNNKSGEQKYSELFFDLDDFPVLIKINKPSYIEIKPVNSTMCAKRKSEAKWEEQLKLTLQRINREPSQILKKKTQTQ
jgi:hypothetical protein